jgi:hypothetical protein
MVHYFYEFKPSPDNIKKIPDILEQMNNCLTKYTGKHNPVIKIDMDLGYEDNYPKEHTEALNTLLSYFVVKQMETGNGYIENTQEGNVKWFKFNSQYCDKFFIPHIQIGGINGNTSISIRKMTNMSKEQRNSLTDEMDKIIKCIL